MNTRNRSRRVAASKANAVIRSYVQNRYASIINVDAKNLKDIECLAMSSDSDNNINHGVNDSEDDIQDRTVMPASNSEAPSEGTFDDVLGKRVKREKSDDREGSEQL